MTEIIYTRRYEWYYPANFVTTVVNAVFGAIEFVLAIRVLLELIGASTSAPFVAWIYGITDNFIAPFSGAFPSWNLGGGYVLNLSALFAMVGYAIIGWIVMRLLSLMFNALYGARV